jgi:hypothetical protein
MSLYPFQKEFWTLYCVNTLSAKGFCRQMVEDKMREAFVEMFGEEIAAGVV